MARQCNAHNRISPIEHAADLDSSAPTSRGILAPPSGPRTGGHMSTCTHLDVDASGAPPPRTPDGCEDCLRTGGRWVHLRLCLDCGHVGCCDSSPNQHASAHVAAPGTLSSARSSRVRRGGGATSTTLASRRDRAADDRGDGTGSAGAAHRRRRPVGLPRSVARDLRRRYGQEHRVVRAESGADALEALREIKLRGDPVVGAARRLPDAGHERHRVPRAGDGPVPPGPPRAADGVRRHRGGDRGDQRRRRRPLPAQAVGPARGEALPGRRRR